MLRYLVVILFFICSEIQAQSFSSLETAKGRNPYDNVYTSWMLRYTAISGKGTATIKGFTFNASIAEVDHEKGEWSFYWENPWAGDLIWRLMNYSKPTTNTQVFTSGLLGWFQTYVNVVSQDRLIVAPGLSFGDYIFGDNTNYTLEPNGYYLHVGPAVKASYLINKDFWLDGFLNWDIGAAVKHNDDRNRYQREVGYPRPFFVNLNINLCTSKNFFGGIRINKLLDRGDNKKSATRLDFSIGYRRLRYDQ